MEDVKASFSLQLKAAGGGSKEVEDKLLRAEAEIKDLQEQVQAVSL